ncbi:hypothetical protein Daus18300_006318, partial [Diaporthe australafricana]
DPYEGVLVLIDSEECHLDKYKDVAWNLRVPVSLSTESQLHSSLGVLASLPPEAYFAAGAATWRAYGRGCSQRLWVWGRWSTSVSQQGEFPQVLSVSALACNESVETVEVEALLFGPDLSIKPSQPPIPHQSSTKTAVQSWFDSAQIINFRYDIYYALSSLSTNMTDRLFDTFFTLLTTSRYAVPLEMLGNQSHASTVAEAIKFQHNIIVAQSTAANLGRIQEDAQGMRNWGYEMVPGTNDTSSYKVTSSVPSDRPRVIQNDFSTRVLQGYLSEPSSTLW